MEKNLRYKISQAIKEKFVGNYIFTENELIEIFNESSSILRRIGCERGINLSRDDYELIYVSLVNLVKNWNSDEVAFFDFIYRKLLGNVNYSGKIYRQITKAIDNLIAQKKIYSLKSYKKKYYATLCSHSFTPLSSIESFFEMCWEIYWKDLNQQYEKNDPAFELITNSLRNKFAFYETNDEDFQIGSKVYSFRVGVRGLAIDKPKLMIDLLDTTMESIHSLYNSEPLVLDKYICVLINDWWKKKESMFGIERVKAHTRHEHIVTDYSQIRAKYVLEEGVAKLIVPSIRLLNNLDYEPYIEIKVNGAKFICDKMIIRGSGILMATKPLEYELSTFSFTNAIDISIEITHCNDTIYNSKETLKREFILFKDSKELLSQDCLPGIYFLYTTDLNSLLQYPKDIHKSGFNTFSLESFEGEVLQSKSKTIFFISEKSNRDLYFFAKEHNDVLYRYQNEEYKVIDGELYVDVLQNIDIKDYSVRYEHNSFKLSKFKVECIDGKTRYQISLRLSVGKPHHISIFKYSDNSILASINFIKFNNIRISFNKDLYYGKDKTGQSSFVTEKYNVTKKFNIDSNEVSIPLEDGEIVLYPPILRWKIDDSKWNTQELSRGLWYKELTNSSILSIELPKTIDCIVALNNNDIIEKSGNNHDYKIGQTIYALKAKGNYLIDYFTIMLKASNDQLYRLTDIYYKELFINEPIFVLSNLKQLSWLPKNYIGDKDSKFRLDIFNERGIIYTKELSTKKEKPILFEKEEGFYKYKITLLGKGFINTERELFEKSFVFGNEKELKYKNKILTINQVMLFDKVEPEKIKPVYIDDIHYLGNLNSYDFYSGSIFVLNRDGKKIYLNYMKDESNIGIKINPVRIEIKSDNSCYLGYGLNIHDEEFEFDDEFSIDSQWRTTIGQRCLGQKTKAVDFFIFEVKNNV